MKKELVPSEETIEEGARKKELILQALGRTVPATDVQAWLHAPNLDLDSRTPVEAIAEGDYAPVIEALWLRDPTPGPVS